MAVALAPTHLKIFVPRPEDCNLVDWFNGSVERFIGHNRGRQDVIWVESPDDADVILLFEKWETKWWTYLKILNDCPLYKAYRNKFITINNDCVAPGILPGCYVSLTPRTFNRRIHRAVPHAVEYAEAVPVFNPRKISITPFSSFVQDGKAQPKFLFSYRGSTWAHPVRDRIFKELRMAERGHVEPVNGGFGNHGEENRRAYFSEINQSKFVLCPRGTGPSSYRMYETMQLGRCPVIISDDWLPIPGIPWEECAIFVKERDVPRIPAILAKREHEAERLGQRARQIWVEHFAPEAKARRILDDALAVWRGLQAAPFDLDAYHRSWRFYCASGWTVPQRLYRRAKRELASLTR